MSGKIFQGKPHEASVAEIAAAYRRLQLRLSAEDSLRERRSLLLTSTRRHEGCSRVAGNLALRFGQQKGARVVVVELETDPGDSLSPLQADRKKGLRQVLAGDMSLSDAILPVGSDPTVHLLPGGLEGPVPEDLNGLSLAKVIASLADEFSHIIVDGPPVPEIPDPPLLLRAFGGVALIVEANRTKREAVGEAIRVLNGAGANLLGIVLTSREYFIPEWIYKRM